MKTQKYLVTIEMPDGDHIGPGWIRDIIQDDCDVEDKGRQIVSVEEYGDVDWDEYRREAAKSILSGICAHGGPMRIDLDTITAIKFADELIMQLRD